MQTEFDDEAYGQRWQVETVMYMLKQHQGDALTARKYQTRRREMGLMCVTHNIMIVYAPRGFLQGRSDPNGPHRMAHTGHTSHARHT